MPLQLLNIGIIVPRVIYQLFTKTPRGTYPKALQFGLQD
jgi:hypothetical protein